MLPRSVSVAARMSKFARLCNEVQYLYRSDLVDKVTQFPAGNDAFMYRSRQLGGLRSVLMNDLYRRITPKGLASRYVLIVKRISYFHSNLECVGFDSRNLVKYQAARVFQGPAPISYPIGVASYWRSCDRRERDAISRAPIAPREWSNRTWEIYRALVLSLA